MALIGTVKIIKTTLHALGSIGNKISGVLNKGSEITANKLGKVMQISLLIEN